REAADFLRKAKEQRVSDDAEQFKPPQPNENLKPPDALPVPENAEEQNRDDSGKDEGNNQVVEPKFPKFKGPQNDRQKAVVGAMKHAWNGYKQFAWGKDTLMPISGRSQEWMGCGLTIIDALDTLIIMGMDDEFAEARKWVETELSFDKDKD
uniref:Alpha-1,2-Mannosidase n=1 Tax=Panagrolaimus sp. JU765 TaxID=591449 RepID=A0AC34QA85_9BILA